MSLPASFIREGFLPPDKLRGEYKRLMIGTDGSSETGKTEFILSAPGPGIVVCLDRGFDAMLDNPNPPAARRSDFGFKSISVPLATQATQAVFLDYWRQFYTEWKKALDNPDARTVALDGDSDSWELQRLSEFGKLTQVPAILYANVNAARRAMIARAWDTGKIIIATNKVKDEYKVVVDKDGKPILRDGKETREKSGNQERQGFADDSYLWQVQLRHLYRPARINTVTKKPVPQEWGLRILKCKANASMVGEELWGDSCNFAGLVSLIYPQVDPKEWGF